MTESLANPQAMRVAAKLRTAFASLEGETTEDEEARRRLAELIEDIERGEPFKAALAGAHARRLIAIKEASAIANQSERTVNRYAENYGEKRGGQWRIDPNAMTEFFADRRERAREKKGNVNDGQ